MRIFLVLLIWLSAAGMIFAATLEQEEIVTSSEQEELVSSLGQEETEFLEQEEITATHEKGEEEFNITEMIMHHIGDSHEWPIITFNRGDEEINISIPLPVILWHKGLHVFMSSKFRGDKTVQIGDDYVTLAHEHIYLTNSNGDLTHNAEGEITNPKPFDVSITRNVASMFLSVLLILWLFGSAANGYSQRGGLSVPKGVQKVVEPLILFVRDDIINQQIHDKKKANFFTPYLITLFVFIIMNNIIGLIPFFPGGSNLTGNISVTLVLGLISFFAINLFSSKAYWKHLFTAPGIPLAIKFFIVPIELIGEITKIFALILRLFANITAGHIIILSITSMIFIMVSFITPIFSMFLLLMMFCLEFLVAFLQAYIFTLLTTLFIGMAVNTESH